MKKTLLTLITGILLSGCKDLKQEINNKKQETISVKVYDPKTYEWNAFEATNIMIYTENGIKEYHINPQ